ncbi:hypothetical protein [Heyndrickxia sporothermodurans]|uniref:hypothetical protein n=1 Tax=Heyndrickxia sporothermodurans TaxID=46224 RepID=UPI0035DD86F6
MREVNTYLILTVNHKRVIVRAESRDHARSIFHSMMDGRISRLRKLKLTDLFLKELLIVNFKSRSVRDFYDIEGAAQGNNSL